MTSTDCRDLKQRSPQSWGLRLPIMLDQRGSRSTLAPNEALDLDVLREHHRARVRRLVEKILQSPS
jgi:hypothetical protein